MQNISMFNTRHELKNTIIIGYDAIAHLWLYFEKSLHSEQKTMKRRKCAGVLLVFIDTRKVSRQPKCGKWSRIKHFYVREKLGTLFQW
jgi:hypothetical protein